MVLSRISMNYKILTILLNYVLLKSQILKPKKIMHVMNKGMAPKFKVIHNLLITRFPTIYIPKWVNKETSSWFTPICLNRLQICRMLGQRKRTNISIPSNEEIIIHPSNLFCRIFYISARMGTRRLVTIFDKTPTKTRIITKNNEVRSGPVNC